MTIWDVMLKLRGERDLMMVFVDKSGMPWVGMRETALAGWQFDGCVLLMPQPYPSPIYPDQIEVWSITFAEDKTYATVRLI